MRPRGADKLREDVGRRVGELRRALGLTQADLAERAGFATPAYLARIEGGRCNLGLASLAKLGRVLGVDAAELLREPTTPRPGLGRPRSAPPSRRGSPPKRRRAGRR
jgi:transcriptional regulator with XRE-family HTH domain